jgi:hypothetical protein
MGVEALIQDEWLRFENALRQTWSQMFDAF